MALSWTRDTNNFDIQESPPIIYILDREGVALDSIAFHGNWRTLTRIQTAANGDIIGAGYAWTDIGWCGWMIRVTSEAELVWEKYIQDNRLSDNSYIELGDVTECDDGGIAAGGFLAPLGAPSDGGNTLRSWVVKLDANGCLEPGCTSDTIHLMAPVSATEVPSGPSVNLSVSPNPVKDMLSFVITGTKPNDFPLRYTITDSQGRILQSGQSQYPDQSIDVGNLPSALYFLTIATDYRLLAVERFIKR